MRPRAHLHIQREGYYKVSQLPVSQSTRFSITPLISHAHCGTYTGWQHVSYSVPQSRRIFPFNICTISFCLPTDYLLYCISVAVDLPCFPLLGIFANPLCQSQFNCLNYALNAAPSSTFNP